MDTMHLLHESSIGALVVAAIIAAEWLGDLISRCGKRDDSLEVQPPFFIGWFTSFTICSSKGLLSSKRNHYFENGG